MKSFFVCPLIAVLAACAAAPASIRPHAESHVATSPADPPTSRITLAELVQRCQPAMATNVTFDQRTDAALRARTVAWPGSERLEPAEAARLFYVALSAAGFECQRVGPSDLAVIHVRAPQ